MIALTNIELDRKAGFTEMIAENEKPVGEDFSSEIWGKYPEFKGDLPEIDLDIEPTPDDFRIFFKGQPIGEDGDLIAVTARLKSYKTTVCNAIAASSVAGDGIDTLGFEMKAEGVFLIFDTEQSSKEILVQAKSLRKRLGVTATPKRIKVISLREYLPSSRQQIIKEAIERYRKTGIAAIVVDGGTDLLGNVNDPEESSQIINFLTVAASKAEAPLFTVVHLNHSDVEGSGGGRGHFGKELERKAKTVLCVEKKADGVGTVYAATTRGKPIAKAQGQRIGWDDDAGMVVSISGTPGDVKRAEKLKKWTETLKRIEARTRICTWKHSELVREITDLEGVTGRTAKTRIKDFQDVGILRRDDIQSTYVSTLPRETTENACESATRANQENLVKR